ncbi:hypothetical protein NDU88_007040 [Pleurodeles waltl]|uniref:Uncharacterized protein n=1 Tax=Pleurodeles waltl TaxID=8319 RepID=A0AAV7QMI6_PLEWA|nr:hypothetical protein NDU88_007040 [Pleurodeles waltl]
MKGRCGLYEAGAAEALFSLHLPCILRLSLGCGIRSGNPKHTLGPKGRDTQLVEHLFPLRQELRELRLLQKEEQRAQQQLSNKLLKQREQIFRRFEQEMTVSFKYLTYQEMCK